MASLRGSVRAVQLAAAGGRGSMAGGKGKNDTVTHAMIVERFGPPLFAGKLNKKGKVNKSFAERWCELRRTATGGQIDYFKKQAGLWKGTIEFDVEVEVATIELEGLPDFCFALSTKKRQYILQAASEDDVASWIEEISGVLMAVRESVSRPPTEAELAADDAAAAAEVAAAQPPDVQQEPARDLWSGDKTAQLGWESYASVRAELESMREDRRQLLDHALKQAQQMDEIRRVVLAMTKDEDTEGLMEGAARLAHICRVDPDASCIEKSVLLPQSHDEDVKLDPKYEAISVNALLHTLTADPPVQCELNEEQKFASKRLEGRERLPSIGASVANDALPGSDGDDDEQLVSLCDVPEFQQAFTDEQMLLSGYEALLCCTVVKPPDFATQFKQVENEKLEAASKAAAQQIFEDAGKEVEEVEQALATLAGAEEPDEEALAELAAVLEEKKEAVVAASTAATTPRPDTDTTVVSEAPELLVARAEAQDYVETVLRPQFFLTSRAHRELVQALSVGSDDNDEECAASSAVGVGVPMADMAPANVLQWRWRCVRFRRPPSDPLNGDAIFRSARAFRSWVVRQLAMVLSGLLLHLQTHDDHVWSVLEGVAIDADDAFTSETLASLLLKSARLITRKLDYANEFSLSEYDCAVEKMSALVMTVLGQVAEGDGVETADAGLDPWGSFVPLNCMLYEQLLSVCMSFNRNDENAHDDDDDMDDEAEDEADALAQVNSDAVVNCLKQTWQPLRLSQAYHATLVVKNALKAFRKQPSKDVLVLLLYSVPDLKPIARFDFY